MMSVRDSRLIHCCLTQPLTFNSVSLNSYSINSQQLTMNYSLDKAGYGICGHKNTYTSKVYDGNWSEDKIATELLMTREVPAPSYQTEQRGNFQNPNEIPEDPRIATVKLESMDDIRAKNKEGLPYALIFDHRNGPQPAQERFKSQYQAAANETYQHFAKPEGSLYQRKLQEAEDERFDSVHMTTMSKKASQRLNTSPPKTTTQLRVEKMKHDLKPETLPKWNRKSLKF
jgi:hypothetical protein